MSQFKRTSEEDESRMNLKKRKSTEEEEEDEVDDSDATITQFDYADTDLFAMDDNAEMYAWLVCNAIS